MNYYGKSISKRIWSLLLVVSVCLATWNIGTYAQDKVSDTITVYIGAEDTAARIAGTKPTVPEAKGVILPLKAVEVPKDATASEAIKKVLDASFPDNYTISAGSYGDYITSIAGLTAGENGDKNGEWGDSSGWLFMVNGKDASTGISGYKLKDQDVIQLYYSCAGYADNRTAPNYEKIQVTVEVDDTAARIAGTDPVVAQAKGVLVTDTALEVSKGANALEAIQSVLQQKLPGEFKIAASSYGAYLTEIAGIRMGENGDKNGEWGDSSGWLYLINGVPASAGMEHYILQNGDRIQVSYSCTGLGDDIGTSDGNTKPTNTPAPSPTPDIKKDDTSKNPDAKAQAELLKKAKKAQKLIGDYVYNNLLQKGEYVPAFGEDGEYAIFSLARMNYPVKQGYYERYYKALETSLQELNTNGQVCISKENNTWKKMDEMQVSDWAKLSMAVTAIGMDAADTGGMNLISKLADKATLEHSQEWLKYPTALLALETGSYTLPVGEAYYTKQELALKVAESMPAAIESGYIDTVAMTLQPLAAFYDKNAALGTSGYTIKQNVELGIRFLEDKQLATGYFNDWDSANNPWSTTQVMIVLGQYGINPLNEEQGYDFIKNGKTVFDTMFEYIDFETGSLDNYFVSYDPVQYLRGLESCIRYLENKAGLFDCSDLDIVEQPKETLSPIATELPAQSSEVPTPTNTNVPSPAIAAASTASDSNSARTGDDAQTELFMVMLFGSAAAGAALLVYKKKICKS